MANNDNSLYPNMQLFQEMRLYFPGLSEEVITKCIKQNYGNRDTCIKILRQENSDNYLKNSSISPTHPINMSRPAGSVSPYNIPFGDGGLFNNNSPMGRQTSSPSIGEPFSPVIGGHFTPHNSPRLQHGRVSDPGVLPIGFGSNHPQQQQNTVAQTAPVSSANQNPFEMGGFQNASGSPYPNYNIGNSFNNSYSSFAPSYLSVRSNTNPRINHHISTLNIAPTRPPYYSPNQLRVSPASHASGNHSSALPSAATSSSNQSGHHTTSINFQLGGLPRSDETQIRHNIRTMSGSGGAELKSLEISVSTPAAASGSANYHLFPELPRPNNSSYRQNVPNVFRPNATHQHGGNLQRPVVSNQPGGPSSVYGHHSPRPYESPTPAMASLSIVDQIDPTGAYQLYKPIRPVIESAQPPTEDQLHEDEKAYTQALLLHQRARLDLFQKELSKRREILTQLKAQVYSKEKTLFTRKALRNTIANPEETYKLNKEIRKLQVECHCLLMEVDLHVNEPMPLGVTDEDFYGNIFTGQRTSVGASRALAAAAGQIAAMPAISPGIRVPGISLSGASPSSSGQNPNRASPNPSHFEAEKDEEDESRKWKCSKCTFANHPALNKCEICEAERVNVFNTDSV